jgi:signal peptidase II
VTDRYNLRLLVPFAATVLLDQTTKAIALKALTPGAPVPVIGDLLRWTLTHNPGGAFGMRLAEPAYYLISSLLILVFLAAYIFLHRRTASVAIPLSFVAGGALGNIIDRFRFGQVVDFIDCDFPDINVGFYSLERWPIFNVADSAVSCGIVITLILMYIHSRKAKRLQLAQIADNQQSTGAIPPGQIH